MVQKEVLELKRRFKKDRATFPRVCGVIHYHHRWDICLENIWIPRLLLAKIILIQSDIKMVILF